MLRPSVAFYVALCLFLVLTHSVLLFCAALAFSAAVSIGWRLLVRDRVLQDTLPSRAAVFVTGTRYTPAPHWAVCH